MDGSIGRRVFGVGFVGKLNTNGIGCVFCRPPIPGGNVGGCACTGTGVAACGLFVGALVGLRTNPVLKLKYENTVGCGEVFLLAD